ncbi:disease resistance protein RPP13-like [Olea europaea var. sylvestris]|uniref:disease resistance protein RPP13-like n=1 Tax=Olea europaea var. sylvestris TaxID=158386 RepID=UPI000C1CD659|nr:disease resistance protein RPP13-like [Olea europaea var. sylvestris]
MTSDSSKLNVVMIHGMDGCGKTTLAENVFNDPLTEYHFPIRAWITVSQEYSEREILIRLLDSIKQLDDSMREAREEQLSEHLYKSLKGRKYLIVMDNVRDTKVWDLVWRLLPKDDEGSRVLLTTSKPSVVDYVKANLHDCIYTLLGFIRNSGVKSTSIALLESLLCDVFICVNDKHCDEIEQNKAGNYIFTFLRCLVAATPVVKDEALIPITRAILSEIKLENRSPSKHMRTGLT